MTTLNYISHIVKENEFETDYIRYCPQTLFQYAYWPSHQYNHQVFYRPALMGGRHIVDVLRAVCGPADVTEAELDRARSEASRRQIEFLSDSMGEGMWFIAFEGPALITLV